MIGRCCFESLRYFELDGLSGLDSVVIGEKSFVHSSSFSLTSLIN